MLETPAGNHRKQDTTKLKYEAVIRKFRAANQAQVFRWWDDLSDAQRDRLIEQLQTIDLDLLDTLVSNFTQESQDASDKSAASLQPASAIQAPSTEEEHAEAEDARRRGEEAIRSDKLAVLLMAGGQATRLGWDAPKGTYPIGPVTGKTLFQHHAEKILALRRRYNVALPWYIMTGPANNKPTAEFFREHAFFGLPEEDIFIFVQGMMPVADRHGKLLLDDFDHVAMSPDGHGGAIRALKNSGALDDMKRRGIEEIFTFQVDNPLTKIADPKFLGYHLAVSAEMSAKAITKRGPEEKLGVFCRIAGKYGVIEYSDLPEKEMHARNADGSLTFGCGNIAIHIINVAFVEKLNERHLFLPFHPAHKKVVALDDTGALAEPTAPNAIKFETFIFDAMRDATSAVVLEVKREDEFAPVKNADGEDSPSSAQALLIDQYARWLERAGVTVPRNTAGEVQGTIEISPLYASTSEEIKEKLEPGVEFTDPFLLSSE